MVPGRHATDVRGQFWVPAADVYQIPSGWIVKLELAGVRPEDVEVTVEGQSLWVRGSRRDCVVSESQSCRSLEISYHRFERRFELPDHLERGRVMTQYQDGMLLLTILIEDSAT
jgi:HSP20 family protein